MSVGEYNGTAVSGEIRSSLQASCCDDEHRLVHSKKLGVDSSEEVPHESR
jgi:hypothetical protein